MFSNTHADTTSSGIHIIRTPDEYQTVLNEADGLFKDRMIKVDKAEPLTSDDLNKLKQAQTLYEELNVFKPIKMGPVFALGRIDLTLGEISTAEDRFRQAILNAQLEDNKALGPSIKALTGESYYFLAQCLEQQNDWKGALEQINQGIAINKDSPNYYYVRARAEVQLKQIAKADADLKTALEMDPTSAPAILLYKMIHDPTRSQR